MLLSVAAFGLLAEAAFRIAVPVSDIPYWTGDPCTGYRHLPHLEGRFVAAGHDTRFRLNDRGWNDPRDYGPPGPGQRVRVAIVGDSYVEALQVEVGEGMGPLLEALFRERGLNVEVRSYGISGASTGYARDLLECEVLADRPDFIVYLFINNDVHDSVDNGAGRRPGPLYGLDEAGSPQRLQTVIYHPSAWRRVLSHLAIFRYFWVNRGLGTSWSERQQKEREAGPDGVYGPLTPWWANAWEVVGSLIAQMSARAAESGAGFLVVNRPHVASFYPAERFGDVNVPESRLARQAESRSFEFQDLHEWFERDWEAQHERFSFPDDMHWNAHGHRVAAAALEEILARRRPDLFAAPGTKSR